MTNRLNLLSSYCVKNVLECSFTRYVNSASARIFALSENKIFKPATARTLSAEQFFEVYAAEMLHPSPQGWVHGVLKKMSAAKGAKR